MRQAVSLAVVSSGTLSGKTISKSASAKSTSERFTSEVEGSSLPFSNTSEFVTRNFPISPFSRIDSMRSAVFIRAFSSISSSITTCFFNNGRSCTSATTDPTLAIVSPVSRFTATTSFKLKSSGKRSRTLPTDTSMPVFSEAYTDACFTAHR